MEAARLERIQTCIVHLLRNSMDCAGWKDRKPVAAARKEVNRAADAEAAAVALGELEDGPLGRKYPAMAAAWRCNWSEVSKNWKMPAREWHAARAQCGLLSGDRFELHR